MNNPTSICFEKFWDQAIEPEAVSFQNITKETFKLKAFSGIPQHLYHVISKDNKRDVIEASSAADAASKFKSIQKIVPIINKHVIEAQELKELK